MTESPEVTVTARSTLGQVLRNPRLRKVQLAFAGSALGDWAFSTAIVVYAFRSGGAAAVGGYQAARFIAMALAGPVGAALADRMSRRLFMITSDAIRAVLVAGGALVIGAGGPSAVVYVVAIVAAMVGAPFRAAQAGLIPSLVASPGELTAANAIAANLESTVIFAGPALGGLLIAWRSVETVFWLNVATFVWSMLLMASLRNASSRAAQSAPEPKIEHQEGQTRGGLWRNLTAGFSLVAKDGDLRAVALTSGAAGLAWGSVTVFIVLLATRQLGTGAAGVGYLNGVIGLATVAGGLLVLTRVGRSTLGQDMAFGTLAWGLPLLVLALVPSSVTAVACLAVVGLGDSFASLGFETIPQRVTPGELISRVYAAIESLLIAPMAIGAAVTPALIDALGLRGAMALVGAVVLVVPLSLLPHMRDLDRRLVEPASLPLLRGVAIFAPLPPTTLETLAHRVERLSVLAGQVVLREGDVSDRFFVIASGSVEVSQGGRAIRTETAGEFFGEIGLLRDVPRTATVTAITDTELVVLDREDFLSAMTGGEARSAAEDVVLRRLAA